MGKRRTRKQKEGARHQFSLRAKTNGKKAEPKINVKGQFERKSQPRRFKINKKKVAKDKAKVAKFTSVKNDIVKVLVQASIILAIELMIYLYLKFKLP